ncbi:MAG: GtrA family protein [Candidatus Staskawiczbacteria bacterium]|nr:GtrA family protein [Candidatus Staskawiczbacteria bacterium]
MILTKKDLFFAGVVGVFVAWLATNFLGAKYSIFLYLFFPTFSVFCLWLAEIISRKYYFVLQAAKFILVGGFADIIDIIAYSLIFLLIPMSLVVKAFSFLVAVCIKYVGNKNWVFHKTEKEGKKEATQFFAITLGGLIINLIVFYCATKVARTEISIILAALAASVWNFLGYKFIVFKK